MQGESYTLRRPPECPRLRSSPSSAHGSIPGRLNGVEKLFKMNPTLWHTTCPKLSHLFSRCCLSPAPCRLVCKLRKRPVLNRVWRLHPRVPVTAGAAGLGANNALLGLAARPRPARHAMPTSVPTRRHTARPLVLGRKPARFPVPDPQPTFDYACSQRSGEKLNTLRPQITLTSFPLIARAAP